MSFEAVFVDGVGRTRIQMIPEITPTWKFAVPRRPLDLRALSKQHRLEDPAMQNYEAAIFEHIGKLRSGRLVYGQREAKYKLWQAKATWSKGAEVAADNKQRFFDAVFAEMNGWINAQGAPRVVLYDVRSEDPRTGACVRRCEGVARPV